MNRCCHPDCRMELDKGHLACLDHWHMVPKSIRREVQIRLRGWKDAGAARDFMARWFQRHKTA